MSEPGRPSALRFAAGNLVPAWGWFCRYSEEMKIMANWKCAKCGYTVEADTPPQECPSCKEKCEFLDVSCYTPDCQYDGGDKRLG